MEFWPITPPHQVSLLNPTNMWRNSDQSYQHLNSFWPIPPTPKWILTNPPNPDGILTNTACFDGTFDQSQTSSSTPKKNSDQFHSLQKEFWPLPPTLPTSPRLTEYSWNNPGQTYSLTKKFIWPFLPNPEGIPTSTTPCQENLTNPSYWWRNSDQPHPLVE